MPNPKDADDSTVLRTIKQTSRPVNTKDSCVVATRALPACLGYSIRKGVRTPLLGMEKYFDKHIGNLKLANVQAWATPTSASASTTHAGFADDPTTMRSIVSLIKTSALAS
jgi:hypothetical protein